MLQFLVHVVLEEVPMGEAGVTNQDRRHQGFRCFVGADNVEQMLGI